MPFDESIIAEILPRVRATPAAPHPDEWMAAAAPLATAAERVVLRARLAETPEPAMGPDATRVPAVQAELRRLGLAAFLVPRADAHQGEYIVAGAERLRWLTGFTGSAGFCVVTPDHCALFVDGRYTLQAPAETDAATVECRNLKKQPAVDWLADRLKGGDRVGFDPAVTPIREAARWREALDRKGAELIAIDENPIDRLWTGRPGDPFSPARPHPQKFAGETSAEKRRRIGRMVGEAGAEAVVLNQLDSIAWLLNVRGGDTPSTPLVQSFLVLGANGRADWFVDPRKLVAGMDAHLGEEVAVRPIETFAAGLAALANKAVLLDPDTATAATERALRAVQATIVSKADPTVLPKARKNRVELAGARAAHRRDGAALTRFLAWFDKRAVGLSETQIMAKLEEIRAEDAMHRGPSFTTIAGSGPNGAIVHYRASEATARPVQQGTLFLLDSGAQYLDGTTDVTRTIVVGAVPRAMKRHFTLVLKGHIAVATARFPKGTGGVPLDALARQHLWRAGLDFDHGTGHGVGSYLGVHEGPARLSPLSSVALEEGMILSNEPGFYRTDSHGIRIENLLVVRSSKAEGFLEFETLTLAPIDRRAIDKRLLTGEECAWVDAYHARVLREIGPMVESDAKAWLRRMTEPL